MARPVLPLFEYLVYEDYIAEFLCVNKGLLELDCNGKCYLMQQLTEQNEGKKKNLPRISMEEYPIGFVQFAQVPSKQSKNCNQKPLKQYSNSYYFLFSNSSFRPPTFLV